ncbi:hypothetical protein V3C40_27630 [Janthinobacterium sp. LS2A]|uniref:hypothetical protein n=1 Tax=Janthinobacterium sp. LS2A TaxID=3118590 RepID=UPI002F950BCA
MNDILLSSNPDSERRIDTLSESIVNSAIDMEERLGSLHAILYMRRHNIDMAVAVRVVLRRAERRNNIAWSTSKPGGFADFEDESNLAYCTPTAAVQSLSQD